MKKMHRHRSRHDNERNNSEIDQFNKGRVSRDKHYSWDDEYSGEELRNQPPKEQYLEKQLEPGDTLQTISIQFNCPISELKRINNIHRDNEVFARRIIKVPVRYYSLLSEKLVGVHKSSSVTDNTHSNPNILYNVDNTNDNTVLSHLHPPVSVINSVDEDCINLDSNSVALLCKENANSSSTKSLLPKEEDEEEILNDSSVLLPAEDYTVRKPEECINDVFQCSGSDWGLSWLQLLSCTLLLLLGGPILYLLYHAESDGPRNALHNSVTSFNRSLRT